MLKAEWCKYRLRFKFLAKTSREEMRVKDTYFVKIHDSDNPGIYGLGECALFKGLSSEDGADYEHILDTVCRTMPAEVPRISSIRFGFECALADLRNGGRRIIFDSDWQQGREGIDINGLVWMGDRDTMLQRIDDKIRSGFKVLKLKIGGIDFEEELSLLSYIRTAFKDSELQLRLDANGSFTADNALARLDRLSKFDIHSIEQPVAAGQRKLMKEICRRSPIAIALDEELIGYNATTEMESILDEIQPQYIILKPSLCGGFEKADEWIRLASERGTGWWATSALESNIGLNAIAQWVSAKHVTLPQGLGTGQLYDNNIASPLRLKGAHLYYDRQAEWDIPALPWQA